MPVAKVHAAGEEDLQRGHHALLGEKAADERRDHPPVAQSHRLHHRLQQPGDGRQDTAVQLSRHIEAEIKRLQEEIEASQKEIERKSEESKNIISYYQVSNGESELLEYLFSASSITDFIYRATVTEQMTRYNNNLSF